MNVDEVVQQLKQQRSRLDAAIQALEGSSGKGKRRGRPPGSTNKSGKRRTMSAAARKRISQAMKKRWAAQKKKAQK
jgi:exonuclease VII small subunit